MSPTPKKDDGWTCGGCNSWNESSRTQCRNCKGGQGSLMPLEFPGTGQPLRIVTIDGEPWMVLADACAGLGLTNPTMAARRLDSDDLSTAEVIDALGRPQQALIVNESGLYGLLFQSRRPEAKAFRKWLTYEVLPAIRRTGSYSAAPQFEVPQTLGEALRLAASQADEIERQRLQLATAEPKAEAWDVLASADPDWSVREAAFILNRDPGIDTGQQRLFNELRRMRVIDSRDIPYASHARHVRLRPRTYTNRATDEEVQAKAQVRITAEGLAYLHKRLGGTAPLEIREPVS